ncbi:MAG: hypothetical protein ACSLE0_00230 [Chitinophagaceae bacterium]
MKIALFETYHFEVANTIISLFDRPENEITIFVYPEAHRQLLFLLQNKATRFTWIVRTKDESNRGFIRRIFHYTSTGSYDLLFFNTISDNFITYVYHFNKLKKTPSVLTLHDINGQFQYKPSLSFTRLVRFIGKRLLIKKITAFNVLADSMVPYLKKKISSGKKIYSLPGTYFDPNQSYLLNFEKKQLVKIVIPGTVDERRRDYSQIKDLLEKATLQNIKIELSLLGAFKTGYSENTRRFCQAYLQDHDNLKIFDVEIVDQPEFDKNMQDCHFIWMPAQPKISIADGIIEEYGKSICSGNIGDAIKYAKPFFVPAIIPLDKPLLNSAIRYESLTDILNLIRHLDSQRYSGLQQKALESSSHYTKEKIIGRNLSLFE